MADDIFVELGSTGLSRFGGYVNEEWLRDLQGPRGVKIYKEMRDNDPIVGAFLFAIEMLIGQVDWRVEAGGNTQADQDAAEFLESCMNDMSTSWKDTISEILSFLPFGWAYHEIVYKRRLGQQSDPTKRSKYNDGRIGWRKLPLRAQETFFQWIFDEDGGVQGMQQIAPPDYVLREIPIEKALLFRTKVLKCNPEGRSILRNAFRPWYFKKNIEEIEGIGIERDLAGLPMAYVPPELLSPSASPEQKAVLEAIKKIVTKVKRDELEGMVFPSEDTPDGKKTGYKFQLLSTGSRRQFDTNLIITRYNQQILMTVLADFIMIGHEQTGSFALSSSKTNIFGAAIGSFIDRIAEVFNTHAIPRLFALNSFSGLTDLPKLAHGDIESPDLNELGTFIANVAGVGAIMPDDGVEQYLRQAANLPQRQDVKKNIRKADDKPPTNPKQRLIWYKNQIQKKLKSEFSKNQTQFLKLLDDNDLSELDNFEFIGVNIADTFKPILLDLYKTGWNVGKQKIDRLSQEKIDLHYDNQAAAEYASKKATELITSVDETARTAIKQTIETSVRNELSWQEIKDILKNNYQFSEQRAEVIARTESGIAYNVGFCQVGKESGMVKGVLVHDGDGCEICAEANGQIWSLDEAIANPIEHPNCKREFEYILSDGDNDDEE